MFCITAKNNDDIVGNIVITIINDEGGEIYGWVDDLFVVKEWRKFGIGKNLLLSAFTELRNQGIKESRLEVWSDNKRGQSVYETVGFKFYKQTECAIGMIIN